MHDPFYEQYRREQRFNMLTLGAVIIVAGIGLLMLASHVIAETPHERRSRALVELGASLMSGAPGEKPGAAFGRGASRASQIMGGQSWYDQWRIEDQLNRQRHQPVTIQRLGDFTIIEQPGRPSIICSTMGPTTICN